MATSKKQKKSMSIFDAYMGDQADTSLDEKIVNFSKLEKTIEKESVVKDTRKMSLHDATGFALPAILRLRAFYDHFFNDNFMALAVKPDAFVRLSKGYMDFIERVTNNPVLVALIIKQMTQDQVKAFVIHAKQSGMLDGEEKMKELIKDNIA